MNSEEETSVLRKAISIRTSSSTTQNAIPSNEPTCSKSSLGPRSVPTAIAVAGPGSGEDDLEGDTTTSTGDPADHDEGPNDAIDTPTDQSSVPLVAEVVSEQEAAAIGDAERRNIMERARLQVLEQIEQNTPQAQLVEHGKPPYRNALVLVALVVAIGGAAAGLGVFFSQRQTSQRETASPPPPEIIAFLRNISYEESIAFPFLDKFPTPAESAAEWIFIATTVDSLDFSTESRELTSAIQKCVLASIYFQSRALRLEVGNQWLESSNECEWDYVECNDTVHISELFLTSSIRQGTLPKDLALLTELEYLDLTANGMVGTIPTVLFGLTKLVTLLLSENILTGSIPEEIGTLRLAESIDLGHNTLAGSIPSQIGRLTRLKELLMTSNRLTGTIPTHLGRLTTLRRIDASRNTLTGQLPSDIADFDDLHTVRLNGNKLNGTVPLVWRTKLPILAELEIHENYLTGPFMEAVGEWPLLARIDVSGNRLTGTISPSIANFKSMNALRVGSNQLEGSFPSAIGQLSLLNDLNVAENMLTGSIPSDLGFLTGFWFFEAQGNNLRGSLPTELGQLTSLVLFRVNRNNLTGSIPTEIMQWRGLSGGNFHDNRLIGKMPFCNVSEVTIF